MPLRAAALALLGFVGLPALAGCLVPESAVVPPGASVPESAAVRALADSLAAAPSPAARRAVAVRALRRAGVTPLAGGLFTVGVRAPLVGGFVPGRLPGRASELVVVGASLDRPAAADVLEVARVLVDLSLVQTRPERTVQVALWSGEDREGLEAAVRAPLWPREAVVAAVVVGDGAVPDSLGGVPVVRVPARGPALTSRLLRAVLDQADAPVSFPPAPPRDPGLDL